MSCLDFTDAIAITKQKIYDLAKFVAIRNPKNAYSANNNNYILNIKCAEDHIVQVENEFGATVFRNGILDML